METTEQKLEKVIVILTNKVKDDIKSDDALKYTQSMLNAAHAIITLKTSYGSCS